MSKEKVSAYYVIPIIVISFITGCYFFNESATERGRGEEVSKTITKTIYKGPAVIIKLDYNYYNEFIIEYDRKRLAIDYDKMYDVGDTIELLITKDSCIQNNGNSYTRKNTYINSVKFDAEL